MAWANACGGLQWEMRPDGLIDVEGQGAISFEPGTLRFDQLAQSWASWRAEIQRAASRHGVPPAWVLAILTEETGLWSSDPGEQATKLSPAGAIGLMQIMPATAHLMGSDASRMTDPSANVDVGAALIAKLSDLRGGQLPEIAAAYNSGSVCAPGMNQWNLRTAPGYVDNVIRWNNSAVIYIDLHSSRSLAAGLLLGAAGLYSAGVILGKLALPRIVRSWSS